MAVRDTLNRIENLVASASHLPLTGKAVIEEEDLVKLVEDLRRDLPQELEQAEQIMREKDNLIRAAQADADKIIAEANLRAEQLVDENDVTIQARDKARLLVEQARQEGTEILEKANRDYTRLREEVSAYANQVFDSLIAHVATTFQGVQNAQAGLEHARQVLQQAKLNMNQQISQDIYARQTAQNYQAPPPGYNQPQQMQQQQM